MSMIEPSNFLGDPDRARRAWQLPVGAASPLWFLYAGAAGAGIAYWLMTRWATPSNLEAILGAGKAAATIAVEASAPVAEAVVQAAEAAEVSLEAVVEEAAEAEHLAAPILTIPPALELVAPEEPAPVIAEAEVVEPVVEAEAAPIAAPVIEPEAVLADLAKVTASVSPKPKPKAPARRAKPAASPPSDA